MYIKKSLAAALLWLAATSAFAQQRDGTVHFSTSCNESAQSKFDHSLALLHSFQFNRAIDGFNEVLRDDPSCAVAYWGIALGDWGNPFAPGQKDERQLRLGQRNIGLGKALGAGTDREQAYLDAAGKLYVDFETVDQQSRLFAYRDAMQELASKYSEDQEAQIFLALAIAVGQDPSDKTYADRLRAGAMLETLFAQQPTHPGIAHYIIHTYDVPALASRAASAAEHYAQIAPDAPHALHMPSHTFTRLGLWQESIDSNLAAAAAARRQGQTAEELHASDYEAYAYLQMANDRSAARIVSALPEIASRFDPNALLTGAGPPAAGYFALAAIPARFSLERHDWQQAEALVASITPFPYADAITWFARGLGAARSGHPAKARAAVTALQRIEERLSKSSERYWALQVKIQSTAVSAWCALAIGKHKDALQQMMRAATMEDATEKSVVTPGPLAPARELLGEMLLQIHRPGAALIEFETSLKNEPRRFWSLYGAAHAATLSGNIELGRTYFSELLSVCAPAELSERAEIAEARAFLARNPGN